MPRLEKILRENREIVSATPTMRFLDKNGQPLTKELKWWIPHQLNVLELNDGGPYEQKIELVDHYIPVKFGGDIELVQVIGVIINYYVKTLPTQEVIFDATETVEAILKNFESGEWEYVHHT